MLQGDGVGHTGCGHSRSGDSGSRIDNRDLNHAQLVDLAF